MWPRGRRPPVYCLPAVEAVLSLVDLSRTGRCLRRRRRTGSEIFGLGPGMRAWRPLGEPSRSEERRSGSEIVQVLDTNRLLNETPRIVVNWPWLESICQRPYQSRTASLYLIRRAGRVRIWTWKTRASPQCQRKRTRGHDSFKLRSGELVQSSRALASWQTAPTEQPMSTPRMRSAAFLTLLRKRSAWRGISSSQSGLVILRCGGTSQEPRCQVHPSGRSLSAVPETYRGSPLLFLRPKERAELSPPERGGPTKLRGFSPLNARSATPLATRLSKEVADGHW